MYQKLLAKAEELGWSCWEDENGGIELGKHSPAGEDLFFYVCTRENPVEEVREYVDGFDPEEHVRGLLNVKTDGFSGVPDVETLVKDRRTVRG